MGNWTPAGWAVENITIVYNAPGSYVNGRYVDGSETTLVLPGVILDRPGNEIDQLGYGNEVTSIVDAYFPTDVFAPYLQYVENDMRIQRDGKSYKVLKFANRNKLLNHFKLTASG